MNTFWDDFFGNGMVRIAVVGVLAILALFLFVETITVVQEFGRPAHAATNTITVSGTGKATAIPDTATVSFSATKTAKQVADAQSQVSDIIDSALKVVKDNGVSEKDIRTTSYIITPHYEYTTCPANAYCPTRGTLTGYDVSQTIQIKIRDTKNVAAILQGLGGTGVTDLYGPNFVVDDPEQVKSEARADAIDQAQRQAQELARQLGVRLGAVVNFSESNGGYPVPMYASGMGGGAAVDKAVSVPTGENEYTENVSITYEIR